MYATTEVVLMIVDPGSRCRSAPLVTRTIPMMFTP